MFYLEYYDEHIEVEIKDFMDYINRITGYKKLNEKEEASTITSELIVIHSGRKQFSIDDMNLSVIKNSQEYYLLSPRDKLVAPDGYTEIIIDDDILKFKGLEEEVIGNILDFINRNAIINYDQIITLLNHVRIGNMALKKIIQYSRMSFSGNIKFFGTKIEITEKMSRVKIGIMDEFTNNINAFIFLDLKGLKNSGIKIEQTYVFCNNTKKPINVQFEYERKECDFLDKKFTEWCFEKKSFLISDIYTHLTLYSIASNLKIDKICRYFLELQIKIFFVCDHISRYVIYKNLAFVSEMFPTEEIYKLFKMALFYLKEKICEMKIPKKSGNGYVILYKSITFLKLVYRQDKKRKQRINFRYTKPSSNIYDQYTIQITKLRKRFTDEILNFDSSNLREYIENVCVSLENAFNLNLNKLFLISKIRILEIKVNNALINGNEMGDDSVYTLICLRKIEKILNTKLKIRYDIINNCIETVTKSIFGEFLCILKMILKDKYEEEISENELKCLYRGIQYYYKTVSVPIEPVILQVNSIHMLNLTRLSRKRKNLDNFRINTLNLNHLSFLNLCQLFPNNEFEEIRLDYVCKENEELVSTISFYKNKMKNLTEEELEITIDYTLEKASRLCDRLFLCFKYNLYNHVINDLMYNGDEIDLSEKFFMKRQGRDHQVR